ncbi:MAG: glycine betaine/proline transport system substrate-binding protein [Candidatus Tokpelaia sp. JSC189]|nr:MAG: glycine betaine/proline transport system substrate-binding protein [Candidatus Tokpelaia sp. JSC189]
MILYKAIAFVLGLFFVFPSVAEESESCKIVRFVETGWTDIVVTTKVTERILRGLGYKTEDRLLSLPVTYAALSMGDVDVFLGYWQPSMISDMKPYAEDGTVETVRVNLKGAKYTLAVPQFIYDEGLKSFNDIARFASRLSYAVYGVEPGNEGNRIILSVIKKGAYGLGNFRLVESSEQAMLSEVEARIAVHQPIVFLGWEPHPMNTRFKMAYLSGGDDFFGPNYGEATVSTNVRKGYLQKCPNVGRLLQNLEFSLDMENEIMKNMLDKGQEPEKAVEDWLQANLSFLDAWLHGVRAWNGSNGLVAVQASFGH